MTFQLKNDLDFQTRSEAPTPMKISRRVVDALRCPVCQSRLRLKGSILICARPECSAVYPIADDIPILLDDRSGIHTLDSCLAAFEDLASGRRSRWKSALRALLPDISANIAAGLNYRRFHSALRGTHGRRFVLVIGGAHLGSGMQCLLDDPAVELVESDIHPGPRTRIVCDAQRLPFEEGAFDGVIVQAVLHLLPDPQQCVREIHRVLAPDGVVYSEMPFLQPAHGGKFDFTRYTLLGHRALYRAFTELASGPCNGPGTALAFALRFLALSFVRSRWAANLVKGITSCTLFWLKYIDYLVARLPGCIDAAAGTCFLGRKSDTELSNADLIASYKGAVHLE